MRTAIVIPARYASSRLPAKPLLKSTGKYLVQHVYEQAIKVRSASEVVIATDDSRIQAACESFGGKCVMTSPNHPTGTDRIAEVAQGLNADLIVNLQGDEPLIEPQVLELLIDSLKRDPESKMATLAVPLDSLEAYRNPNCVKVVCDRQGRALYFSRSPIPFVRDGEPDFSARPAQYLQHLGLYAYRREALLDFAKRPAEPLENLEKLEQLRAMALGWSIQVGVVPHAGRGVDTFEDYQRFVAAYSARRPRRAEAA